MKQSSEQQPKEQQLAENEMPIRRTKTHRSGYADRRAFAMLLLGFAAGVPNLLIFSSLSLWLTEAGLLGILSIRFVFGLKMAVGSLYRQRDGRFCGGF